MNSAVSFHPAAIEEARAAREWYAERNAVAAIAFQFELDRAVDQVVQAPLRWPGHILETRRYIFHRFPFILVYRVEGNDVQVLAVAHARRKPGYWKLRRE